MEGEEDQPLTPAGRLFLRPELDQVVNCAFGLKHPIDVEAIKAEIKNSVMIQHPRFCSLLVRDKKGREHWRRTKVEVERHVLVRDIESDGDEVEDEDADEVVNRYLADLSVSTPLNTDKPLWEFHLLPAQRCCILRLHHALGDGISLMSLALACCRRIHHPDQPATIFSSDSSSSSSKIKQNSNRINICRKVWKLMGAAWLSLVFISKFVLRSLWVKDAKTAVSGGAGVELWPRKLATARFDLEDLKAVKKSIVDATINDVLFGVISSGLSRYLDLRSPTRPREGLQITGMAMVNLRKEPGLQDLSEMMRSNSGSKWGNQFGFFLLPLYYHRDVDPLRYVKRAKAMLDQKKQSLEAHFSYRMGDLIMSLLGPKFASLLNYNIICNTSFTISNIFGPQEEIMIAGNPITYLRANSSSLPHAITMHMVSYAGRADMQILVPKEIIPNPQVLAKCFQDALLEMKEAAAA
ncbi:hypothetical protein HHK36_030955 [Tetracentron sinense]|uniref:Diacylglycerol O-acyltransferase n=1 Tax=Tetracentron sinense TaxID=13715 RepID=A0A834Y8J0_TETSI|nr:hypothetical protein HHK36_030955 [Tetracentron sinense]